MSRKTRRRRARAKKGSGGGVYKRELRIAVDGLEMARGYDGPFRGKPEPALLVAAFAKELSGAARLLARTLLRFRVDGRFPTTCAPPPDVSELKVKLATPARVLLLVVAFEEDAGDDVTASYARCEDLRAFSIWDGPSAIPDPCVIEDAFEGELWSALADGAGAAIEMTAVRILVAGKDLADSCSRDDYVGASAQRLALAGATEHALRARTVSANEKNDWTVLLRVTIR